MTANNGQSTAMKAACSYLNGEPDSVVRKSFSTVSHHECRDAYPPYGFYILNRVGMDDYISRLYPEDELFDQANILIIRSFPDFLARRLAGIETSTSGQTPDKFSNIYAIPDILDLGTKEKGRFLNIGLWMQPTDSRESMLKVMKRCVIRSFKLGPCSFFFPSLHSYVRLNLPYPQEFRYGPGKPPPPHRLRAVPKRQGLVPSRQSNLFSKHVAQNPSLLLDNDPDLSDSQSYPSQTSQSDSEIDQGHESAHSTSSGDLSAVERLFANLGPYPQPSVPAATVTIDTLFASAMDKKVVEDSAPASPSTTAAAGTGISLLDIIFASADPNRNSTLLSPNGSTSQLSSPASSSLKRQASVIHSPQPSSSASPPQILNEDVISGLLSGFPPTRTTSAASTTYSIGAVSHPSSREGDNEDNSESEGSPRDRNAVKNRYLDNGLPEVGIVFDINLESDPDHHRPSGSAAARIAGSDLLSTLGFSTSGRQDPRARINGDVTPRAPFTRPGGSHRLQLSAIEATSSVSTVQGNSEPVNSPLTVLSTVSPAPAPAPAPPEANRKPRPNRNLVPFAPDSELWPYTRGPVQENSHSDLDDDEDDGDIVELSFEETSVLSDPEAFKRALQRKKSGLKGAEMSVNGHRYVNGTSSSFSEKEKGKENKKSRKERDAIARREIEESWDVPPPRVVDSVNSSSRSFNTLPLGPPASPSPRASQELSNTSLGATSTSGVEMMRTPTTAKATLGNAGKYVNGISAAPAVTAMVPSSQAYTPAKAKGASNGVSLTKRTQNGGVDAESVRESMVTALEAQPKPVGRMEKNEFVREVLALIRVSYYRSFNCWIHCKIGMVLTVRFQTDKAFVDTLWQQYSAHLA